MPFLPAVPALPQGLHLFSFDDTFGLLVVLFSSSTVHLLSCIFLNMHLLSDSHQGRSKPMECGIGVPASQLHHHHCLSPFPWMETPATLSWSLPSLSQLHSPPLGLSSHYSQSRNLTNQLSRIIASAVTSKKTSIHSSSRKRVFPWQLMRRPLLFAIFTNVSALIRLWVPWNSSLALSHLCMPSIWYKINTQSFLSV